MKILYITTIGGTMGFFKNFIKELITDGHTVDIATNETTSKVPDCYREWDCRIYQISCTRSPFDKGNIDAIRQIRKIAASGGYDIVHCHTPIAAMCTRLACHKLRKSGLKVFYTAHGFHFYKGAPLKNWLVYYPIEWLCAHWTDTLITINKEDYALAQKRMRAGRVEYVPGVGIDVGKFVNTTINRAAKRQEISVPEDAFLLLSVGELSHRKNHEVVIRALAKIENKNIHYVIAGRGDLQGVLGNLVENLSVKSQVHLLGYRSDIPELYKTADVCALPSFQEGLPVALMEGMASGLPVICSNIRGNVDLIRDNESGLLCRPSDTEMFATAIERLYKDAVLRNAMAEKAENDVKKYDVIQINQQMKEIYGKM